MQPQRLTDADKQVYDEVMELVIAGAKKLTQSVTSQQHSSMLTGYPTMTITHYLSPDKALEAALTVWAKMFALRYVQRINSTTDTQPDMNLLLDQIKQIKAEQELAHNRAQPLKDVVQNEKWNGAAEFQRSLDLNKKDVHCVDNKSEDPKDAHDKTIIYGPQNDATALPSWLDVYEEMVHYVANKYPNGIPLGACIYLDESVSKLARAQGVKTHIYFTYGAVDVRFYGEPEYPTFPRKSRWCYASYPEYRATAYGYLLVDLDKVNDLLDAGRVDRIEVSASLMSHLRDNGLTTTVYGAKHIEYRHWVIPVVIMDTRLERDTDKEHYIRIN